MIKNLFYLGFFLMSCSSFSQIELPNNSVRFNASDSNVNSPTGFEIPAVKAPSLTNTKNPNAPDNSDLGKEKEKQIDMQNGDGLLEYSGTNKAPKYFSKDKEEKPEYGKDQYLGDFKTKAKKATFMYRDHEFVDGDMIRIYVNGEIAIPRARLEGSFRGFDLPLQDGFNKVDFEALNQGTSGPNTAQLNIYDEVGNLLASYEWNLLTGNKATAIIVKQ
ncbi:MAG: hypothetical protein CL524_08630 [Aequorivita sp.]|jgi:hypothetical protein|nr:hypothetical protein [Aequorivita sp.]MBF30363.1 hypothetical protein [Aequorivita sp.]|tara:strand:+ start:158893 stop:159546 length:654 start_codon:yes stop_codon:yes gene_type:complete